MSKRGRPCTEDVSRNKVVTVRMTEEEVRILDHLVEKNGENRADILRKLMLFAYFDSDFM